MNIVAWFRGAWRDDGRRRAVISEYASLRQFQHVLADIALRGGVFGPADPTIPLEIAEGRRQLALETLRLAGTDPATLMTLCFEQPRKDRNDA